MVGRRLDVGLGFLALGGLLVPVVVPPTFAIWDALVMKASVGAGIGRRLDE